MVHLTKSFFRMVIQRGSISLSVPPRTTFMVGWPEWVGFYPITKPPKDSKPLGTRPM